MEKIISSDKMFFNNKNDMIMFLLEHVFEAKSLDTSVTLEQVINKGIEMNLCETWPTEHTGHPWYPHTSHMCGIHETLGTGNPDYECYLHRALIKRGKGRKVFVYWVDRTKKAQVIGKDGKPITGKTIKTVEKTPEIIRETKGSFTQEEMEKKVAENPGKYIICDGKLLSTKFVVNHPNKFNPATVALAAASYKE